MPTEKRKKRDGHTKYQPLEIKPVMLKNPGIKKKVKRPPTEVQEIQETDPTNPIGMKKTKGGFVSKNATLAALIRDVGDETVEGSTRQWTRIEAVVRSLYADALAGKTAAAEILFERGWGKIPTPIEVNVSTKVQEMFLEARFTYDDIKNDPVLMEILMSTGLDELQMRRLTAGNEAEVIDGEAKPSS